MNWLPGVGRGGPRRAAGEGEPTVALESGGQGGALISAPLTCECSVAISADSERELLEIAMQHAAAVHGHKDTPEGRNQLRKLIKDGNPPETVQAR
jgi:predicted small metal-binding protein